MSGLVSEIKATGQKIVQALGTTAVKTDTLGRVVKVGISGCEIASPILGFVPGAEGVKAGVELLKGKLKTTKNVIYATNFLERGFEWTDPTARKGLLVRWQKTANRVCLLIVNSFDTVFFVDKLTCGFFGQAAACFCTIPIFELVKNFVFVLPMSTFGIWNSTLDLIGSHKSNNTASQKIQKWKQREMELGGLDNFKTNDILAKYRSKIYNYSKKICEENSRKGGPRTEIITKWEDKIENWIQYRVELETDVTKDNFKERVEAFQKKKQDRLLEKNVKQLEIAKTGTKQIKKLEKDNAYAKIRLRHVRQPEAKELRKKIKTNTKQIADLKTKGVAVSGGGRVSIKIQPRENYIKALSEKKVDKVIDYKVEKYSTRKDNNAKSKTKSWISIASDVAKIAIVTISTLTIILAVLLFPQLAGPGATLFVAGLGLVASSAGLTKNIYREIGPKPVAEPHFEG